ncbi:MAG TPA: hypothetical protein VHN20_05395 [Beijerinckiaceae bacterium]|nr:hypothetical protein [Beijerinckiaceae bacterium]
MSKKTEAAVTAAETAVKETAEAAAAVSAAAQAVADAAREAPAAAAAERTLFVEFKRNYRPHNVPEEGRSDSCWKYRAGQRAHLPYAEARRAVGLEIAAVAFEDEPAEDAA